MRPASSRCVGTGGAVFMLSGRSSRPAALGQLFKRHHGRPTRFMHIDRESVTRTLIAGGMGVGVLHAATAKDAEASGEVDLVGAAQTSVRVLFAHLAGRAHDPLLGAVRSIVAEA